MREEVRAIAKPCGATKRKGLAARFFRFLVPRESAQDGFTLVELLVSILIFTMITTVAVFNNAQFNGSVLLTNLAYEIALSVRQAQFYGITVKRSASASFDTGYGINFNLSDPTTYYLFEDRNKNYYCDASECALSSVVETFKIRKGNYISKICLDGTQCSNVAGFTQVDVAFVRPNPDALITKSGTNGTIFSKAEVCISSPKGTKRKIVVESTGQISVSSNTMICDD